MLWLFSAQIKLFECCAMDREPVGKIDNTRSPGEDANPTFTSNDNHINMPAETHPFSLPFPSTGYQHHPQLMNFRQIKLSLTCAKGFRHFEGKVRTEHASSPQTN